MNNPEGAWIFLSHSHEDWGAVRDIRNILEAKGHRPLMFFLKCLSDHAELNDLIKREIQARTWFLLCESDHAKRSRWVQEEVTLIKSMPDKYFEQVDLEKPMDQQLDRIDALCRRATVYLSYARDDTRTHAGQLLHELQRNDYYLRGLEFSVDFDDWQASIARNIDDALMHGFVLILLSAMSAKKEFLRFEIEYAVTKAAAIHRNGSVVPIVFGEPRDVFAAFPPRTSALLQNTTWFGFTDDDFHNTAARLIRELKLRAID